MPMHGVARIAGVVVSVAGLVAGAADWPQWRGPSRDDLSKETGLLKAWPADGPKSLWVFREAGIGYSGPAVVQGVLYTMGLRGATEVLIAVDAASGQEKWAAEIGPGYRNGWGDGPRGTPTVSGGQVFAMGGTGALVCVGAADGKVVWKAAMKDLGGSAPQWGYAESPLVDGERVICTPGGAQGAMAALNRKTGEVVWRSVGFTEGAQYASPVLAEIGGTRQYVQLTMKKLAGVAADSGKLLWQSDWPGRTAVIPTPIVNGDSVFVTAGYGAGCKLVKVGAGQQAADVYANPEMSNHHGGVILIDGNLYGCSDKAGWVCMEFATGKVLWASKALGKGCVAYADGLLYCVGENDGTVVLVDASPAGWQEHGRFKLDPQSTQRSAKGKVWTHPVIADGRLFLRDQEFVHAYDVKAK